MPKEIARNNPPVKNTEKFFVTAVAYPVTRHSSSMGTRKRQGPKCFNCCRYDHVSPHKSKPNVATALNPQSPSKAATAGKPTFEKFY